MKIIPTRSFSWTISLLLIVLVSTSGFIKTKTSEEEATRQYQKAYSEYRNLDYVASLRLLRKINLNEQNELSCQINLLTGICYSSLGYARKAIQFFDKAEKCNLLLSDLILYEKSTAYYKNNQLEESMTIYQQIAANHPNSPFAQKAMFQAAELSFILGHFEEAEKMYLNTLRDFPNYARNDLSLLRAGGICEQRKDYYTAAVHYKKLLALYPSSLYKVNAENRLEELKSVLADFPDSKAPDLYKGAVALSNEKKFEESDSRLREILNLQPQSSIIPQALMLLGLNRFNRFDHDKSLAIYNELINRYPGHLLADDALLQRGKIYQRKKWHESALKEFQSIIKKYPASNMAPNALYRIADHYKSSNNYKTAMKYFADIYKKYPKSTLADDAIWETGYYYYNKKEYRIAWKIYALAENISPNGDHTPKCLYWGAKAAEKAGLKSEADILYNAVITKHSDTFYAYRVYNRFFETDRKPKVLAISTINNFKARDQELTKQEFRIKLMHDFNHIDEAKHEIAMLSKSADNPISKIYSKIMICDLTIEPENYYQKIKEIEYVIKDLGPEHQIPIAAMELAYPKAYWEIVIHYAEQFNIDPFLVSALIREESRFNPYARSGANAMGLMQIMPPTGQYIAKRIGLTDYSTGQLYTPETNVKMGAYYLSYLLDNFNNDKVLALASYNGGASNTKKWVAKRSLNDIDEFIENIPFSETKIYVKKVLKSYWMYKRIYQNKDVPMQLG